jgi:hypothetical protein
LFYPAVTLPQALKKLPLFDLNEFHGIFATTMTEMTEKKSRTGYWLLCLVSVGILIALLMFQPEAFWLALPTSVGGLAMAMDWI